MQERTAPILGLELAAPTNQALQNWSNQELAGDENPLPTPALTVGHKSNRVDLSRETEPIGAR